jgi:hypothetical protein
MSNFRFHGEQKLNGFKEKHLSFRVTFILSPCPCLFANCKAGGPTIVVLVVKIKTVELVRGGSEFLPKLRTRSNKAIKRCVEVLHASLLQFLSQH